MKKNSVLGIDIGQNRLKLALVNGGSVKRTASAEMPEGVFKDGRLVHHDMVSELIKTTMKEAGIRATYAALAISGENTYIKHIDMPMMNVDQLRKNLPYEFNDFIEGDPNSFVFDYVTEEIPEEIPEAEEEAEGEGEGEVTAEAEESAGRLALLGVASPKDFIDNMTLMLKKAGLKMYIAAPELSAYAAIIAHRGGEVEVAGGEFGFVDFGYRRIRLFMFKDNLFMTSRELEWGISDVVSCIADELAVENFTARTYLEANYQDCQDLPSVRSMFDQITVELKRSLDFYRFSNPDSQLRDIWITGGGAFIDPLIEQISTELTDIMIHSTDELLPELSGDEHQELYLKAAGIAMNQ